MSNKEALRFSICKHPDGLTPWVLLDLSRYGLGNNDAKLRVLKALEPLYWHESDDVEESAVEFQLWVHGIFEDGSIVLNPRSLSYYTGGSPMPKELEKVFMQVLSDEGKRQYQFSIRNREQIVKECIESL